jgi:FAD/FMN-containing dehydrogenase
VTTTYEAMAKVFDRGFHGATTSPGNPGYDAARALWNGAIDTHPSLIAHCLSASDVVTAVNLTREAGVPLAVKAGGHSVAGFSSCDDGVVVDLSLLRAVDVDPQRRRALVEPGATWADFDTATGKHGLASTGGLVSSTGVAGLTLGGGIGWLQRKFGLACDNLRSAQVVTADGRLIDADDELLWGLRGGGGNFGVVTSFEFDLHPVPSVLGGMMIFPFARGEEVLRAFGSWAADAPDEAALLVAINFAPAEAFVPTELVGQQVVLVVGCWCGELSEGESALAPLRALGPVVDLFGPMSYPALQGMLDGGSPHGLRNYFRGGYLADLSDQIIAALLEQASRMSSPRSQIHLHQMGGAVSRVTTAMSSFSGRGAGYTYNLIGTWTDPSEDSRHIANIREMSVAVEPLSMGRSYVNFDADVSPAGDRVRSAYGDEIYRRLARLKREYDPTNLFRRNQNVRPAR